MGAPHILLSDVWDVKFWSCGDQQTVGAPRILFLIVGRWILRYGNQQTAGAPHILLLDVWDQNLTERVAESPSTPR